MCVSHQQFMEKNRTLISVGGLPPEVLVEPIRNFENEFVFAVCRTLFILTHTPFMVLELSVGSVETGR